MSDLSLLQSIWFVAVVALWVLYLVLEGFDFGVGMLMRRVRRDHVDRRVALHTIGPTWAANEVWVVVAVVAMFGAFPEWYATWSSALYLPLFVVLLALISRNAAIELIGKRSDERWRVRWERVLVVASTVAPFCWGLMWSAVLAGVELRGGDVVAGPLDVVSWYSVLGGLSLVVVCRALGAAFLSLRTDGDVRAAAERSLRVAAPVAFVVVGGFVVWTVGGFGAPGVVGWIAAAGCVAALGVAAGAAWRGGAGARGPAAGGAGARAAAVAFGAGCAAIGLLVVTWFAVLFPAGVAGGDGGAPLLLADAAAGSYTLTLMTIVAGLLLPVLIGLQAWSYWLFRHRMTRADVGAPVPSPVDMVARVVGSGSRSGSASSTAPSGPGFRRRRRP